MTIIGYVVNLFVLIGIIIILLRNGQELNRMVPPPPDKLNTDCVDSLGHEWMENNSASRRTCVKCQTRELKMMDRYSLSHGIWMTEIPPAPISGK